MKRYMQNNCLFSFAIYLIIFLRLQYSAEEVGGHGGGGEYGVQLGFGWSNGVVLDLLNTYGEKVTPPGSIK